MAVRKGDRAMFVRRKHELSVLEVLDKEVYEALMDRVRLVTLKAMYDYSKYKRDAISWKIWTDSVKN